MSSFAIVPAVVAPIKASYALPAYIAPVRAPTDHLPTLDLDTLPSNMFWTVLGRAVTLRRDHLSQTEAWFVSWLCNRLPVSMIDASGNVYVDMRTDPTHRTLFTAHTDTVHHGGGVNKVHVDGKMWRASQGHALGADDGAGIAILCHLIEAQVPGLYVFFRGEERGGIGSRWASKHMANAYADLDRAIAFDRAGYYDVITHQAGGRCCSDVFANALADQISLPDSWFAPSDMGVFTDTAELTDLIPECTNVSVGYRHQHGDMEQQDVEFLWSLAQQCVQVAWDALPTVRNPKVPEPAKHDIFNRADWVDYRSMDPVVDDTEDDEYVDDEADLWDALDWAMMSPPQRTPLMRLISQSVYPDDPQLAFTKINPKLLDDETLGIAFEMLDTGWPAPQILEELWNMVSVA